MLWVSLLARSPRITLACRELDYDSAFRLRTVPKGETLQAAFERAKDREPPSKVLLIPNKAVRLLASLCRELQEMAGSQPFVLHQLSVAKLFGHSDHRNISNWIRALKALGMLKLAEAAIANARAARYFYIE